MSIFNVVKSKLSILDVVQEYVQLKRAGGYWKGSCPFHQETDASFTVSPDKQIYYCFGCHSGGDLIAFIAKAENLTQIESVHHLVDRYAIDIPDDVANDFKRTRGHNSEKKEQFFRTCEMVARWCHEQLTAHRHTRMYLENRNVQPAEWDRFLIGYFPGGTSALNRFLKDAARENVLLKDLMNAGIVSQGRNSIYSAFEERIIFPIRDSLGRCCGFGGRVFGEHDERAKYYNSRESEWFAKGTLLFGLTLAKKEMQQAKAAFLVEGYTDCVAMVQFGYKNTVATLGTACTVDHLKTLSRLINVLYVLYDGDAAGQKAILRLTKLCWQASLDLQIVTLPVKDDPASFLEKGGDLRARIEASSDIFSFFVQSLGGQFWGKTLSEKMELSEKIIEVIAKVGQSGSQASQFKQDLLLQQAAVATQIPFGSLKLLLTQQEEKNEMRRRGEAKVDRNRRQDASSQQQSQHKDEAAMIDGDRLGAVVPPTDGCNPLEEKIVSLVINIVTPHTTGLQTPHSAVIPSDGAERSAVPIEKDLLSHFSPPVRKILETIELFVETTAASERTFDALVRFFKSEAEQSWIIKHSFVVDDEDPEILLEKLLFRFRRKNWKHIVQDIRQRIGQAKRENNTEELEGLLRSFLDLKQEMKQRGLI